MNEVLFWMGDDEFIIDENGNMEKTDRVLEAEVAEALAVELEGLGIFQDVEPDAAEADYNQFEVQSDGKWYVITVDRV